MKKTVRTEVTTTVSPEDAWRAFADPTEIARWFVDRAERFAETGKTQLWSWDEFGTFDVNVIDAVPGARYVIGGGPRITEVTFERQGGRTVVRLVESGFAEKTGWDDEYEGVRSGWTLALAALVHYLEHFRGRDRSHFLAMQPARYDYAQLVPLVTTAAGQERWLASRGAALEIGRPYRIERDGGAISGRVLARSDWETICSWDEIDGVIEFKGFRFGDRRVVAIRASSWTESPASMKQLKGTFAAPLERLAALVGGQS